MKSLHIVCLLSLLLLLGAVSVSVQAQPAPGNSDPDQIGPPILPPIEEELCPGQVHGFQFTVILPQTPAKGDVVFAFDTTGSMGGVIASAQENATLIMNDLNSLISDVQFGVVDIEDYPLAPYGTSDNQAYVLRRPLTDDRDAVQAAIDSLAANTGEDFPEAYTRALYEAHTDADIGWRDNARHLLLMFGDSVSHDDALNEGIRYPPYVPPANQEWETGHPPSYLDPGPDGIPGTEDDLDLQTELNRLADEDITLLHVVTSSTYVQPDQADLVTYWDTWARVTDGRALPLWNVGDLPEIIREIVEDTIDGIVKRIAVEAEPELFDPWVYSDPAEITDVPIPTNGEISFLGRVQAPADTPAGTYRFRVMVVGDGIIYGEKPVRITVPGECFLEPEYPFWYYLPVVAKNYE